MKRSHPSSSSRHEKNISSASKRKKTASPAVTRSPSTLTSTSTSTEKNNRNWKQWKQQQTHDYNTHQFLDSSATVHAGLFGARRLPEIKSLWRHVVQNEVVNQQQEHSNNLHKEQTTLTRRAGESGGGKISSRHLRRRTGSHKRRRRHRFPRGIDGGMDESDVSKASLDHHHHQQQKKEENDTLQIPQQCRRARRKPALLKQRHSGWWQPHQEQQTPEISNWIPTHLWHAKRFHVSSPIFSWSVPLVNANRGSRASLRLATSQTTPKCTIQDATWEIDGGAIELRASQSNSSSPSSCEQLIKVLLSMMQKITDVTCLSDETVTSGQRATEGLIHEIDSFPGGIVGPGTFIFKHITDDSSNNAVHLSVFVHPAMKLQVTTILSTLVGSQEKDSDINVTVSSTESYSLLRVRGTSSTITLENVLSLNWGDISNEVNGNEVEHGTLLKANVQCESSTSYTQLIIKCHKPNQQYQHLPQNVACSGWDIFCHPSVCNDLFQTFVCKGGSCAIGLVEDARAQLEAYPPLAIFPRDFPDSRNGRLYWEGDSATNDETQPNSWALIRSCIEGSWGRNNRVLSRHRSECRDGKSSKDEVPQASKLIMGDIRGRRSLRINWTRLVSPNNDEHVIIVRGSFGIPFLQLLHGCGRIHMKQADSDSTRQTKRRPRRPVRPPNVAIHAPSLSKEEKIAHLKTCQQLSESLSLPALLRCELFFDGKGSPSVGDIIFSLSEKPDEESTLGLVVAGGFSPSRGKAYAVAFVGAAKFIAALDGTEYGMVKDDAMFLKVAVANKGPSRRYALLSPLL